MLSVSQRCFVVAAILTAFACKQPEQGSGASPSAKHAPVHAAPGSHEDWCSEHAVPESLCTRCNPALIAAFKASGDWCPEHGLPESQCRICNPNLKIERPPAKAQ